MANEKLLVDDLDKDYVVDNSPEEVINIIKDELTEISKKYSKLYKTS